MTDTNQYKTRLEEEKNRLETELADVGRRNPSNPSDWEATPDATGEEADPNDTADQLEDYSTNAAILNDLEIRHTEVESAIARIENGSFGTCSVCDGDIEEERLNADPAANTCLAHIDSAL